MPNINKQLYTPDYNFPKIRALTHMWVFQMIWPIRWEFYKWDWHAFWPPKNPPLYSRKYECNYHFVEGSFLWVWRFKGKKHKVAVVNFQHFSTKIWHGKKEYGKIKIGLKLSLYCETKSSTWFKPASTKLAKKR